MCMIHFWKIIFKFSVTKPPNLYKKVYSVQYSEIAYFPNRIIDFGSLCGWPCEVAKAIKQTATPIWLLLPTLVLKGAITRLFYSLRLES